MADDAEKAVETYQKHLDGCLEAHLRRALKMQEAQSQYQGECDLCGEYKPRLVERQYRGGPLYACGRCRDNYKLG